MKENRRGRRAAAYLCAGFSCRRPVADPKELAALLDQEVKRPSFRE